MPEPFSQLRARRNFLQPQIELCLRLCHAAGPETFDQDSLAIIFFWFFVSPFQLDHLSAMKSHEGRMKPIMRGLHTFCSFAFSFSASVFRRSSSVFRLASSGD